MSEFWLYPIFYQNPGRAHGQRLTFTLFKAYKSPVYYKKFWSMFWIISVDFSHCYIHEIHNILQLCSCLNALSRCHRMQYVLVSNTKCFVYLQCEVLYNARQPRQAIQPNARQSSNHKMFSLFATTRNTMQYSAALKLNFFTAKPVPLKSSTINNFQRRTYHFCSFPDLEGITLIARLHV